MIQDLGLYLYETEQQEFQGTVKYVVIHDDPRGKHVTFFTDWDGKEFIGSLVTKEVSKEVMSKLKKQEQVSINGRLLINERFETAGPPKEIVIPLIGELNA